MPEISEKELTDLIEELDYFKAKISKLIQTKPKKKRKDKLADVRAAFERDHIKMFGRPRN